MEVKRELLERALNALSESVDSVRQEYMGNWRHGIPTRKAQLDAEKAALDEHEKAIYELRAALSAPERKPMTLDEIKSNPVISYFGVDSGEKIVRAVEAFHDIKEAP